MNAEVYRCSLLIQEPFSAELGDRQSEEFEFLSERFISAIEDVYRAVDGTQTATVQTFECVRLYSQLLTLPQFHGLIAIHLLLLLFF